MWRKTLNVKKEHHPFNLEKKKLNVQNRRQPGAKDTYKHNFCYGLKEMDMKEVSSHISLFSTIN
jgi:hypothetical protein